MPSLSSTQPTPSSARANPYLTQPLGRRIISVVAIYLTFIFVIGDAIEYGSTLLPIAMADLGGAELYAVALALGGILGVVAMPLLGFLATRNPHLKPALLSGTLFIVAAVVIVRGLAPNIGTLLGASVLMSVGTAGSYVIGLPLIRDMFPVKRASLLLGFISTVTAIGLILGPIVLGAVIDNAGWRAVSWVIAPGLILAGVLLLFGARLSKAAAAPLVVRYGTFDALGAILLTLFIAFLSLPLSLGSGLIPYGGVANSLLFVGAAVAVIGLALVIRRRQDAAFIPASVFRDRNTLALIVQVFLGSASSLAVQTFVPVYVLLVMGGSALEAGIAAALYAIPSFLLGPAIGRWIGATGTAAGVVKLSISFKVVMMGVLGIWMLVAPGSITIVLIYVAMFVAGFFSAGQQGVTQTSPQIMIKPSLRTQGTAAVSVQLSLGPIIGGAAFGGMIVGFGPAVGIAVAILAAAVLGLLAIIPAFFMRPLSGADAVDVAESREEAVEASAEAAQHGGPAPAVS